MYAHLLAFVIIAQHAERAGVGLPDKTVVNLDVRKTWQLKPNKLSITNFDSTLKHAVKQVSQGLGTNTDYNVSAHLYKLLLYEPGCFFLRHRDNERLDGMFGTLIIELPSVYQGAELSVWSPLTPSVKKDYGGQGDSSMHYTAFYADCYHQVSELTSGHRVALIYHLTAHPKVPKLLKHLPDPPPLPAQPAEAQVVQEIADRMYAFANETKDDYPRPPEGYYNKKERNGLKPSKFAIVLSHHYTPAGLAAGLDALKGSDRAVGELIRAAAWCRPSQMQPSEHEEVPYFDAVLSLAILWDGGEMSPDGDSDYCGYGPHGFRTTGPLLPLVGKSASVPLNMGPAADGDLNAEYDPKWFKEDGFFPDMDPEDDLYGVACEAMDYTYPDRYGNHSLPIFCEELLFASEGAKKSFTDYNNDEGNCLAEPKDIEFLGNGMPYPGRWYSRSVILVWPKEHREAIELQSKGGRAMKEKKTGGKKSRSKKQKRSA